MKKWFNEFVINLGLKFNKFAVKIKNTNWFKNGHPLLNGITALANFYIIASIWGVLKYFNIEAIDISSLGPGLFAAIIAEFLYLVMHAAEYEEKGDKYHKDMAMTQLVAVFTYLLLIITALVQAIILWELKKRQLLAASLV